MPTRKNLQLARIFGIRIGVSWSWFFVLFFLIYYLSEYFHEVLGGSQTTAYLVAVAGALGYFASLILHELGHALVARRNGLTAEEICEVLLHTAVYAGLPASNRAFAIADEVLREEGTA